MKQYIYAEDHQMYYKTFIIFKTDCLESVEKMSRYSWEVRSAGRFSVSFEEFSDIMKNKGYLVEFVSFVDEEFIKSSELPIIVGATGNY